MTVTQSSNSWADERVRTTRTEHDWIVHTVDNLRATLDSYAMDRFDYLDELRKGEPHMAALVEQILSVYGEPPRAG